MQFVNCFQAALDDAEVKGLDMIFTMKQGQIATTACAMNDRAKEVLGLFLNTKPTGHASFKNSFFDNWAKAMNDHGLQFEVYDLTKPNVDPYPIDCDDFMREW